MTFFQRKLKRLRRKTFALLETLKANLNDTEKHRHVIYSQEGEDILLQRIMQHRKSDGFYVDVGAHHPSRYSNTFYFYKQGWRGINIDASPGSMLPFKRIRPRDINLEMAVSAQKQTLKFHRFKDPALNSANPQTAQRRREMLDEKQTAHNTVTVSADTLATILEQHLPYGQHIDFLSIDIEGSDLEALQSNNWSKYRPDYILVEILGQPLSGLENSEVARFLKQAGYSPLSKLLHTVVFKNADIAETPCL